MPPLYSRNSSAEVDSCKALAAEGVASYKIDCRRVSRLYVIATISLIHNKFKANGTARHDLLGAGGRAFKSPRPDQ